VTARPATLTRAALARRDRAARERIEALEERVRVLEKGLTLADSYRGPHVIGQSYRRGHIVTRQGSLWLCLATTIHAPGCSASWVLIVKGVR
jgi:hypothetical protein